MSEEKPFTSMRITLSDEAIRKLGVIRKRGRFRSNSGTIEEVIRAIFELIPIYETVAETIRDKETLSPDVLQMMVDRSMAYLYRFALLRE